MTLSLHLRIISQVWLAVLCKLGLDVRSFLLKPSNTLVVRRYTPAEEVMQGRDTPSGSGNG
jgi:hypothetical protein